MPSFSSCLNLVERWFGKLTEDALRRGNHCSIRELEAVIENYIAESNDDPKPFTWAKTADQILASVARRCQRMGRVHPIMMRTAEARHERR